VRHAPAGAVGAHDGMAPDCGRPFCGRPFAEEGRMSGSISPEKQWVERVLGVRFAAATSGSAKPTEATRPQSASTRLHQGLLIWNNTRSYVGQQITKLQQAIVSEMRDEPDIKDIVANIGNLEEPIDKLDDSLTDKLSELRATTDPAQQAALSNEARAIVARFQKYVAEDGLMNEIDDNGFIPLDIKPKVTAALAAVLQTI
jgi:hypothetical protein